MDIQQRVCVFVPMLGRDNIRQRCMETEVYTAYTQLMSSVGNFSDIFSFLFVFFCFFWLECNSFSVSLTHT